MSEPEDAQQQYPESGESPAGQAPRKDPLDRPITMPYAEVVVKNIGMEVPDDETVAPGWTPFAITTDGFEEPDYAAIELDGRRVQGILAERRYDVSFVQTINTEPGLSLTFSMDFKVDPGADSKELHRPEGLVVGVGLDPTGGKDPRSDNVQWALRDLAYSQRVTASATAVTENETITVFIRNVAFIPGSSTASGYGTAAACANICVREQYARTYLLLPPGASEVMWRRAAKTARRNNWTLGGSADDAGLASALLSPRPTVRAVNPGSWPRTLAWPAGLVGEWFATYYPPGVTFISMADNQLDPA